MLMTPTKGGRGGEGVGGVRRGVVFNDNQRMMGGGVEDAGGERRGRILRNKQLRKICETFQQHKNLKKRRITASNKLGSAAHLTPWTP
jgi:hypothetical protein